VSTRRDILVPPATGPFASLGAELGILDAQFDSVDSMNEAEHGKRASKAVLNAGQAAADLIRARRGKS
jgi:hypothetical protein